MRIRSKEGRGTIVSVRLPISPTPPETEPQKARPKLSFRQLPDHPLERRAHGALRLAEMRIERGEIRKFPGTGQTFEEPARRFLRLEHAVDAEPQTIWISD